MSGSVRKRRPRRSTGFREVDFDTELYLNPKIVCLSPRALSCWFKSILYANHRLTDGRLPSLPKLAQSFGENVNQTRAAATELLREGRFEHVCGDVPCDHPDEYPRTGAEGGCYVVIHGFLDHNMSRAEVEARRAELSANGKRGNEVRHHGGAKADPGNSPGDSRGDPPGDPRGNPAGSSGGSSRGNPEGSDGSHPQGHPTGSGDASLQYHEKAVSRLRPNGDEGGVAEASPYAVASTYTEDEKNQNQNQGPPGGDPKGASGPGRGSSVHAKPTKPQRVQADAERVIESVTKILGDRARGKGWRTVNSSLRARLRAGATPEDCILVAECKADEWVGNATMERSLKQSTLYGAKHWDEYLDQARTWDEDGRQSQQRNRSAPPPRQAATPPEHARGDEYSQSLRALGQ